MCGMCGTASCSSSLLRAQKFTRAILPKLRDCERRKALASLSSQSVQLDAPSPSASAASILSYTAFSISSTTPSRMSAMSRDDNALELLHVGN